MSQQEVVHNSFSEVNFAALACIVMFIKETRLLKVTAVIHPTT